MTSKELVKLKRRVNSELRDAEMQAKWKTEMSGNPKDKDLWTLKNCEQNLERVIDVRYQMIEQAFTELIAVREEIAERLKQQASQVD